MYCGARRLSKCPMALPGVRDLAGNPSNVCNARPTPSSSSAAMPSGSGSRSRRNGGWPLLVVVHVNTVIRKMLSISLPMAHQGRTGILNATSPVSNKNISEYALTRLAMLLLININNCFSKLSLVAHVRPVIGSGTIWTCVSARWPFIPPERRWGHTRVCLHVASWVAAAWLGFAVIPQWSANPSRWPSCSHRKHT